jgi:hypothetical protein
MSSPGTHPAAAVDARTVPHAPTPSVAIRINRDSLLTAPSLFAGPVYIRYESGTGDGSIGTTPAR